jgi:hypothetical protein
MTTRQEQHWLVGHRNDTQSHMTVLEMLQSTVEAASRVRALTGNKSISMAV